MCMKSFGMVSVRFTRSLSGVISGGVWGCVFCCVVALAGNMIVFVNRVRMMMVLIIFLFISISFQKMHVEEYIRRTWRNVLE